MRTKIQGINVDILSNDEALEAAKGAWGNKSVQIVTLNPEMVINAHKNEEFKEVLNAAELVIADGIGISIALRFKNIKAQRLTGINFAYSLLKEAEKEGKTVALVGAREEILNCAISKIMEKMPKLKIIFSQNGYFEDENEIVKKLEEIKPNLILTALGSPRQEFFNNKLKNVIPNSILIGVGGSFDVWAGMVKRAPVIWQKMGLEWLYRTIKQPERFKRIFPVLPIFLFRSIIESVKDRF